MPEIEAKTVPEYNPANLQDYLPIYYKRIFPHKPFYRWLSYGLSEPGVFTNREFSFTLMDDIYIRYLSFENEAELEKEIINRCPFKIDIGPVMNIRPKDHRTSNQIKPIQRELVFDIDMTDYDEVRTCCNEANVCQKCWKFMGIACKILDSALREDFGFEHILWVFSGRRGVHCWVCDDVARHLDTKGRSAIAEYLQVSVPGGENSVTKVTIYDKMHHSVKRAFKVIEPLFEEICIVDQNIFGTPEGIEKLVKMVSIESIRKDLKTKLESHAGDSNAIWNTFVSYFESLRVQGNMPRKFKYIVEEVKLAILYPRLDINVSKGFNHLLKSPFCVHPKTGKICVPFNPNVAFKFDPTTVPTIDLLLAEINAFDEKENENSDQPSDRSRIKDVKKTSMFKGIFVFEEFLRKLEQSIKVKAIEVSDLKMEF